MLTYTYISKGQFGLVEKPKPTIQHERVAIVKVTLELLSRICKELNVDFGDIVSYVPDEESKT